MSNFAFIECADGTEKKLSDKHLAMVRRGAELTRLIKDAKKELDDINAQLKKHPGINVSIVLPNEVRVPISESVSMSIKDADALKEHLGTRKFNQLVKTTVSHKPNDKLIDLAESDDSVAEHLSQRTTKTVKYLPIKTAK